MCGPYDSLELACAWKVVHERNLDKYTAGVRRVKTELQLLGRRGKDVPGLPVKTDRVRGFTLSEACNEVILLHGVNPDRLLDLLSTGLNERFAGTGAGTAFGDGAYCAEDVGKTEQHVGADSAYDPSNELHKRVYGKTVRHPCGCLLRSRGTRGPGLPCAHAADERDGHPLAVPGATSPIVHHTLIAADHRAAPGDRALHASLLLCSLQVSLPLGVLRHIEYHRCYKGHKLSTTTDNPYTSTMQSTC